MFTKSVARGPAPGFVHLLFQQWLNIRGSRRRIGARRQARSYERDGYLVFDPELPTSVLEGAVCEVDGHYTDGRRVQDAWKFSPNVKAIATAPRVLDLLRFLYGREPLPFQTLNFAKGTEQHVHSDAIHFTAFRQGSCAASG